MIYLAVLLLFIPSPTQSIQADFKLISDSNIFMSSDETPWVSQLRQYCFKKRELVFELQYEFSPIAIPTFKVKSSLNDLYISVEADEHHPLKMQMIAESWEHLSKGAPDESICFEGAYLPPKDSDDGAYILVETTVEQKNKFKTDDYLISEEL